MRRWSPRLESGLVRVTALDGVHLARDEIRSTVGPVGQHHSLCGQGRRNLRLDDDGLAHSTGSHRSVDNGTANRGRRLSRLGRLRGLG